MGPLDSVNGEYGVRPVPEGSGPIRVLWFLPTQQQQDFVSSFPNGALGCDYGRLRPEQPAMGRLHLKQRRQRPAAHRRGAGRLRGGCLRLVRGRPVSRTHIEPAGRLHVRRQPELIHVPWHTRMG